MYHALSRSSKATHTGVSDMQVGGMDIVSR
jgi:hypothetical protein